MGKHRDEPVFIRAGDVLLQRTVLVPRDVRWLRQALGFCRFWKVRHPGDSIEIAVTRDEFSVELARSRQHQGVGTVTARGARQHGHAVERQQLLHVQIDGRRVAAIRDSCLASQFGQY